MNRFEYVKPENLQQTFEYLKAENSVVKGGGIDLLDLVKEGLSEPGRVINIRDLPELKGIRELEDGGLAIGAAVTLAELSSNKTINSKYLALAQAAESAATPQIRNAATLAGNLCQRPRCWYFRSADFNCLRNGGDECYADEGENQYHAILGNQDGCIMVHPSATAVALLAFNARLKIVSPEGEKEIAVADFFVAPDQDITREHVLKANEIITEIILPATAGAVSYYFKQKEKQAFDWPIADVAVVLNMKNKVCSKASVVLGSAAPVPWRLKKAEVALKGQSITVSMAQKIAEEALADAMPVTMNAYKVPVFKTVLYRTICWAAGIDPLA